jgi:hypothetical protein
MNSEDRSSKDDESVASSSNQDSKNAASKAERFQSPFAFVPNMPDPRSRSLDGIAVTDSLDYSESDASLERRQRSLLSTYAQLDSDPLFVDLDRYSGRVNTIPEDMAEFIKAKRAAEQKKTNTAEAPNDNAKRDYNTFAERASTEDDASPERESKRRRQIGWGDTFAHLNEGKWQCAACLVYTVDEESKCSACEIPRPSDTNAQGETTTATMAPSADTPTLGFGIPASNTLFPPIPHGTSSNVGFRFVPPSTASNTGFIFGATSSTTFPSLGNAESLQGSIPPISQSTSMAPAHPFVFGTLAPAPTGNALSGTFIFGSNGMVSAGATTGGEAASAPPPRRVTPAPMPPIADSTPSFVFGAQPVPPPLVPLQDAAMDPSTSGPPVSLVGTANATNGEAPRGHIAE